MHQRDQRRSPTAPTKAQPAPTKAQPAPTKAQPAQPTQLHHNPLRTAPPAITLQRDVPHKKYTGDEKAKVEDYAGKLDGAVQKAWAGIKATPALGRLADYDGHTYHWAEKITDYAKTGTDPGGLHTAFGYAVESLATGPLKPGTPSGLTAVLQGARGGTRPDVILRSGTGDVAWLDITASKSHGHIFNKVGWDALPNYAEVTYPSIEQSELSQMKTAVGTTHGTDPDLGGANIEAALKQKEEARAALAIKMEKWKGIVSGWMAEVLAIRGDPSTRDATRAARALTILRTKLNQPDLDAASATSVLWSLGITPTYYGLLNSASTATGISILQDADPSE
jgi:hypothetical protein